MRPAECCDSLRALMEECAQMVSNDYDNIERLEAHQHPSRAHESLFNRKQKFRVTHLAGDMVVSLPGTTHPMDWGSNMNVVHHPVYPSDAQRNLNQEQLAQVPCAHKGFWLRCQTLPFSQLAQQAAAGGQRLVFTGHSLGGAVAAMAALEVLIEKEETGQGPEVLCLAFAAPIWCNSALAQLIDDSEWSSCFLNVTVPEDYCLRLFNNVLTSAAKRSEALYHRSRSLSSLVMSHASSFGSLLGLPGLDGDSRHCMSAPVSRSSSAELEWDSHLDDAAAAVVGAAAVPLVRMSGAGARQQQDAFALGANADQQGAAWGSAGASSLPAEAAEAAGAKAPRKLDWAADQVVNGDGQINAVAAAEDVQPAAASDSTLLKASQLLLHPGGYAAAFAQAVAQELDFFEPYSSCYLNATASPAGDTGSDELSEAESESEAATSPVATPAVPPVNSGAGLPPKSPSSVWSASASSSRSWRLLAALPGLLTRSVSFNSSGSWGSAVNTPVSRRGSAEPPDTMSLGSPECVPAPVPTSSGSTGSGTGRSARALALSSKSSSSLLRASKQQLRAQAHPQKQLSVDRAAGMVLAYRDRLGGASSTQVELRMVASSALLRLLPGFNRIAAAAQKQVVAATIRALLGARTSVIHLAKGLASRALAVPLDVVEKGLIAVLRPPMYCSIGQQWVLTATGLVPQQKPIDQYPQYPWDVFWHRDLAMVAFKQHSIDFYKHRLLQQATRQ